MIRIRRWSDSQRIQDQEKLDSVLNIYQQAFPYYPGYVSKIVKLVKTGRKQDFETILLLAEGAKGRILGFSLFFYFDEVKLGYLDYIASDPARFNRGIGAALYEATRSWLIARKANGLLMDVPPDEKKILKEPGRLTVNKKRLAFYERYGARPIINTRYETLNTKANAGFGTFLVFDGLDRAKKLRKNTLCSFIEKLLAFKGNMPPTDVKLQAIFDSIVDDPIQLRKFIYKDQTPTTPLPSSWSILDVVDVGDDHQIHHLHEKGYVERPSRISSIKKGLVGFRIVYHKVKNYSPEAIRAVHDKGLVEYLAQSASKLNPNELLYPTVFPQRHPDRIPKTWSMRAGYYCIDTFTPLTSNVYHAAKKAANGAITGANLILDGANSVYVACRPPGHHAERKAYGGFCYFNNAAIGANLLSRKGKVAFIDLDYHHGNGSQDIFYKRKDVLFISIHGHPSQAYPYYAGFSDETGEDEGLGFNINYPLFPEVDDKKYLSVLKKASAKIVAFKPDYLVVSLGLDIMKGDPTGTFSITIAGMQSIGVQISALNLPTLIVQEGGYSQTNLKFGIESFFKGFLKNR